MFARYDEDGDARLEREEIVRLFLGAGEAYLATLSKASDEVTPEQVRNKTGFPSRSSSACCGFLAPFSWHL